MPVITLTPESVPVTTNDPTLTRRLTDTFTAWFGADRVKSQPPTTGGEDFSEFGRTTHRVPICMWWVGATDPEKIAERERTGVPVPSNHSATFAPVPEPTLKACVTSMSAAVLDLLRTAPAGKPEARMTAADRHQTSRKDRADLLKMFLPCFLPQPRRKDRGYSATENVLGLEFAEKGTPWAWD